MKLLVKRIVLLVQVRLLHLELIRMKISGS